MRQKVIFVWHVLIFNVIKPFPCSSQYLNNHFQPSVQNAYGSPSHYIQIVRFGKEQLGWAGEILANIALMLFCLPISFLADWIIHTTHLLSIKVIVNAMLVLMIMGKFDILQFSDSRNFLKLLYVFSCLISSSYWFLTCVFLALFENIIF